jgi:nitrate reductase NapE component
MRDVVFVVVVIAFFALAAAYVGACGRIIGREELTAGPAGAEDDAVGSTGVRS